MERIKEIPYWMLHAVDWWKEQSVAYRLLSAGFLILMPGAFISGAWLVQTDCAHYWWLIGLLVAHSIAFVYHLIQFGGCILAICCLRRFWRRVTGSRWRNDTNEVFVHLAGAFMREELGLYGEQRIALDALLVARALGYQDERTTGSAGFDLLRRFYGVEF